MIKGVVNVIIVFNIVMIMCLIGFKYMFKRMLILFNVVRCVLVVFFEFVYNINLGDLWWY